MATLKERTMQVVMARLTESPAMFDDPARVERSHRTAVTKERAPRCHVVDGDDVRDGQPKSGCAGPRAAYWTVRLFVRSDEGYTAGDDYVEQILARLDPENETLPAYPGAVFFDDVRVSEEIADTDALRVDLSFRAEYNASAFSLS